jgi:pimeloyl-ACP methyl ester carboxylesterase
MYFPGRDGSRLAYQETGTGRPLILIHGHQERGAAWVESGLAGRLAARGYRVIMPDLRAHGDSARSHDPGAYPPDVLADDGLALVDHLGLADYDLAGHSLGGRTVLRMLIRGAAPRRAVVSGQGLEGIAHPADRAGQYRTLFRAGRSADGNDPRALLLALDSWVNTDPAELAPVAVPVLILTGAADWHNETAQALADALPRGRYAEVPGDHSTALRSPEFWTALTAFLAE